MIAAAFACVVRDVARNLRGAAAALLEQTRRTVDSTARNVAAALSRHGYRDPELDRLRALLTLRDGDNGDALDGVFQVLLDHGRADLVAGAASAGDVVRAALTDGPPATRQIVDRIAEVLWQTGQRAPAAQHAFLSRPACLELAYALAPVVADWLRRAHHSDHQLGGRAAATSPSEA